MCKTVLINMYLSHSQKMERIVVLSFFSKKMQHFLNVISTQGFLDTIWNRGERRMSQGSQMNHLKLQTCKAEQTALLRGP